MTIGRRIKDRREMLGMKQSDLARRVKVTPSAISQIEAHQKTPSSRLLRALADELQVTSGYLLEGSPAGLAKAEQEKFQIMYRDFKDLDKSDQDTFRKLLESMTHKKKRLREEKE